MKLSFNKVGACVVLLGALLGLCVRQGLRGTFGMDASERLAFFAKAYSGSVAMVAVEYWLKNGEKVVYRGMTVGTAFLVDRKGRLLTNRHVACPWLEDARLKEEIRDFRTSDGTPEFGYKLWVCFEGTSVLRKARKEFEDPQLTDVFSAVAAFRSDGTPSASIVGVIPLSGSAPPQTEAFLGDDVAVLQVTPAPSGRLPIPLLAAGEKLPALLDPVLALGFPMGVDVLPGSMLVASASMGHVRRCFPRVIQADVSLHAGNSGGPVVDAKGRVIGIASSICREDGFLFSQPQSDMGLILPVEYARGVLAAVAAGRPQWDGAIDPALDAKLTRLVELARMGDRHGACQLERAMTALCPERLLVGAALHIGDKNPETAQERLRALLAVYPDHAEALLLTVLMTRQRGAVFNTSESCRLMALDWRSVDEFYGYLVRVMAHKEPLTETPDGWDDPDERALLNLVVGVLYADKGDYEMAQGLLQKSLLLGASAQWPSVLALAELERVQEARYRACSKADEMRRYDEENEAFAEQLRSGKANSLDTEALADTGEDADGLEKAMRSLEALARREPTDTRYPIALAFKLAGQGEWQRALGYGRWVAESRGRESANRLGTRLMHAQLLALAGCPDEAATALRRFRDQTQDPWYRDVARALLDELPVAAISGRARSDPANQLTLHTALGLQAEAALKPALAIAHYLEALESPLEDWYEYSLAKARIAKLRAKKEE